MSERTVALIGVPTSAGAFAPGQEQAPAALRAAGLVARLGDAGLTVADHGDCEPWRWRPDRETRSAQNLEKVVEIVADTAGRVGAAAADGAIPLVLGGDCTVGIGTVAGQVACGERVGLLYFDTHADLNVPSAVREGALDWMGVAHMLAEPGACRALVEVGSEAPLLDPSQLLLFGWGRDQATEHEREAISRRQLRTLPAAEVAGAPEAAAARALGLLEEHCDRLLVHFDVDVVDFTDTPLSENTGRNEGMPFSTALAALRVLLASPKLAAVTITELNPNHMEEGSDALERLGDAVAAGLAAG